MKIDRDIVRNLSPLNFLLKAVLVGLICFLGFGQSASAQSPKSDSAIKIEKPQAVKMTNTQQETLSLFKGDEVFYRPDKDWGFKFNLEGFNDLRKSVSGMTIVCFAVREDSIGLTLAHLYVHSFSKLDSLTTTRFYANRLYEGISTDTTVALKSLSQSKKYGFETLEYDRTEVWPQPDPNNPGQMFDSTLVRRHFNAIMTYRKSWIELHLSKTEYDPADSALFTDLLSTFGITENFERKRLKPAKVKSVKQP